MTPLLDADPICGDCFLYERRGVCPAAHAAYGLQNSAEAERRAEQFRQAVTQEAQATFTLAELVRIETERQILGAPLPGAFKPALPAAPTSEAKADGARKEASRVFAARPPR
jgi:hypothetical protein